MSSRDHPAMPLLFAVVGAALVLARTLNFGVALHADSVIYISVARNLLAGDGFLQVVWGPMTHWPPLYPLLLAVPGFIGLDPHTVAAPINATLFGLTVFVFGRWLLRQLQSRLLAWLGGLAAALSPTLVGEAAWALSETLFILLTTSTLVNIGKFLKDGDRPALFWAAVLTALTCLTRYLGVALVATVALLLILQPKAVLSAKMKRCAKYGLISLLPLGLWLLRNHHLSGTFFGPREGEAVHYSLSQVLNGVLSGLALWVFPDLPAGRLPAEALAAVLVVGLALSSAIGCLAITGRGDFRATYASASFAVIYVGALALSMLVGTIGVGVQPRYLVPIYLPVLFIAFFALDQFVRLAQGKPALKNTLAGAATLWLAYSAALQIRHVGWALQDGPPTSFNNSKWLNSDVLRHVRKASLDGTIYSNDVLPIYMYNDQPATYRYLLEYQDYPQQLSEMAEDKPHVIWFYDWWIGGNYQYNDFDLRFLPGVRVVADLADGLILRAAGGIPIDRTAHQAGKEDYANALVDAAGPQKISAAFNVHLNAGHLTYIKEGCTAEDVQAKFFLHIRPAAVDDLPGHRRRHGFDNLDFRFSRRGLRHRGKCVARISLPNYVVSHIRTGQWVSGEGNIWQGEVDLKKPLSVSWW